MATVSNDNYTMQRGGVLQQGVFRKTLTAVAVSVAMGLPTYAATLNTLAPGAWQLPVGHYTAARMSMTAVYPRPDTETSTYARHRWAYPGDVYEVPVGVQGGAWPFHYEVTVNPGGASIGQNYGDPNYGIVTWTAPSSGTSNITVRVWDQQLNYVDLSWTITSSATPFLFVSNTGSSANPGTKALPLSDITDFYLNNTADTTYANRIVVFRGGTYNLAGDSVNNNNNYILSSGKPLAFIRQYGESVTVNCNTSKFYGNTNTYNDITSIGIRYYNARQDVTNAHFFWLSGIPTRTCFALNTFDTMGPGTSGTDNTCPIYISDNSIIKDYHLVKQNTFTGIYMPGVNSAYLDSYICRYVLWEENTITNSNTAGGMNAKECINGVSIRGNKALGTVGGVVYLIGAYSPAVCYDHEICWNLAVTSVTANTTALWVVGSNRHVGDPAYVGISIYRNTIIGNDAWLRFATADLYFCEDNIIVNDNLSRWDTTQIQTPATGHESLTAANGTSNVDANGDLINSWLSYVGKKGYKVSA